MGFFFYFLGGGVKSNPPRVDLCIHNGTHEEGEEEKKKTIVFMKMTRDCWTVFHPLVRNNQLHLKRVAEQNGTPEAIFWKGGGDNNYFLKVKEKWGGGGSVCSI